MNVLFVILVIAAVLFLIVIGIYNSLITKRTLVENAFACIDTQLKKRYDLIPNLVSTVKMYMTHERETLTRIAELRGKALAAQNQTERFRYDTESGGLIRNVIAQAENYPELKSNENFMHLQRTLNEIEEQLSAARRAFNAAVTDYNKSIQIFPVNMIAAVFGFRPRDFFSISETERQKPNVKEHFQ